MKNLIELFYICILLSSCVQKEKRTPNIILVMSDDQGYGDISVHGSPDVSTPNMDKLKGEGISLEDFQVSPTCAPTRSALLTGRHPFKNGITHTILERERMALGITTLPEVLKRGGYTSGIFGKWHLGDEDEYQPENRGFDEVFIHGGGGIGQSYPGSCADAPENTYFNPKVKHNGNFVQTEGYCTDVFFTQALSWIKKSAEQDDPFFAYIATNAAHIPFIAPEKYTEKFNTKNYPKEEQGFYGMIENIDDNLGLLMEKIDDWGISDNTILIFMSDNGKTDFRVNDTLAMGYNAGMKGLKCTPYEGGTKVPFFIKWPGNFNPGIKVNALLNHFDLLPTLADIAGIDISDLGDLDGQSFLSNLKGEEKPREEEYRFIHSGRWPLNPNNVGTQPVPEDWVGTIVTSNPDSSKYANCAVRNSRYRFVNNEELYDIQNDPGETKNIAAEHPEIILKMRIAYNEWWGNVRPYMVNENVPLGNVKPFISDYKKQKKENGIGKWTVPSID